MTPVSMPMVQYWKYATATFGINRRQKDGHQMIYMQGEAHPLSGIPRSHMLYGKLSKMKHEIKNQIFNNSWARLDTGARGETVAKLNFETIEKIYEIYKEMRFDVVPPDAMTPAVKEIYRAWTKAAPGRTSYMLRDMLCMVLQEDDSYRNRVQWMATHFSWLLKWINPVKCLDKILAFIEHAEVVDDMKERQRLLRRVVMKMLEDDRFRKAFLAFWKECDWSKVKLTEGDKYHFRAKYFKVDLDKFEY